MIENLILVGLVLGLPWKQLFLLVAFLAGWVGRLHTMVGGAASSKMRIVSSQMRRTIWAASAYDEENNPMGFVVGSRYVGYVSMNDDGILSMWLLCPRGAESPTRALEPPAKTAKSRTVLSWGRFGNATTGVNYVRQQLLCPAKPTTEQKTAIERIAACAAASRRNGFGYNVVVWLDGPPGCGKSQVGALLTRELDGAICLSHNPMDPGDELAILHLRANPGEGKPLILVLNEWDCVVRSAFTEPGAFRFDNIVPEVWDKVTYNNYMDRLSQYDDTIVILTSNSSIDAVRAIDPAAVRPGRIDLELHIDGADEVEALRLRRFV